MSDDAVDCHDTSTNEKTKGHNGVGLALLVDVSSESPGRGVGVV